MKDFDFFCGETKTIKNKNNREKNLSTFEKSTKSKKKLINYPQPPSPSWPPPTSL